jgi:hypothetical protein
MLEPSAPARSLNSMSQTHASQFSSALSWGDRVTASSDNLGSVRTASVQHHVAPTRVETIPVKVNAPVVQQVTAGSNMFSSQVCYSFMLQLYLYTICNDVTVMRSLTSGEL